jgi:hypothetical protein
LELSGLYKIKDKSKKDKSKRPQDHKTAIHKDN